MSDKVNPTQLNWLVALTVFSLVSNEGCHTAQSPVEAVASATDTNLKRVTKLYSLFMKNRGGQGPANREELKAFVRQINQEQRTQMGIVIEDFEFLFVSERDHRPLKIRWKCRAGRLDAPVPIVFEPSPDDDGRYLVGFTGGLYKQVDKATFDSLWSNVPGREEEGLFQNRR